MRQIEPSVKKSIIDKFKDHKDKERSNMTKDEIIEQAVNDLKELRENDDYEVSHDDTDRIFCWILSSLGCDRVIKEFTELFLEKDLICKHCDH
jgi:hypothetical protein